MNAVDTNILIYACDANEKQRCGIARELLNNLDQGVILWQVACEFLGTVRKLSHRGGPTLEQAFALLDGWIANFPLVLPQPATLSRARQLMLASQISSWDALILAACVDVGIQRLFSEDLPGQRVEGLEIINPFAQAR